MMMMIGAFFYRWKKKKKKKKKKQDLKDATRVVVTLDDKIMGDNIFFCVVVSFMCVCDV